MRKIFDIYLVYPLSKVQNSANHVLGAPGDCQTFPLFLRISSNFGGYNVTETEIFV